MEKFTHFLAKMVTSGIVVAVVVCLSLSAQAQIPNPGFENWYNGPNGYDPVGWITSNALPFVSVEQATPGYSGNYAVRVKAWSAGITTVNGVCQSNAFNFSSRPSALSGFVKCTIMPGDSAFIVITVTRGGIAGQAIGAARKVYASSVSTYTAFNLPIQYGSSSVTDTIYIDILAGSGYTPSVGTEIIVDDLSLAPATGIEGITTSGIVGQNYPNPSREYTTIPLNMTSSGNIVVKITDLFGREIKTVFSGFLASGEQSVGFSVSDLANGVYTYSVQGDNFRVTRKFTVRK